MSHRPCPTTVGIPVCGPDSDEILRCLNYQLSRTFGRIYRSSLAQVAHVKINLAYMDETVCRNV